MEVIRDYRGELQMSVLEKSLLLHIGVLRRTIHLLFYRLLDKRAPIIALAILRLLASDLGDMSVYFDKQLAFEAHEDLHTLSISSWHWRVLSSRAYRIR